jgi:hypothetical protein
MFSTKMQHAAVAQGATFNDGGDSALFRTTRFGLKFMLENAVQVPCHSCMRDNIASLGVVYILDSEVTNFAWLVLHTLNMMQDPSGRWWSRLNVGAFNSRMTRAMRLLDCVLVASR